MSRSLQKEWFRFFPHSLGIFLNFLGKDYRCRCHHCDRAGGNHSEEHRPSCCQGFLDLLNDTDMVIVHMSLMTQQGID